jgi:hypothetical protein
VPETARAQEAGLALPYGMSLGDDGA